MRIKSSPVIHYLGSGDDEIDLLPYRFVGYYEYGQALRYLTELIRRSKPEEIEAYNRLISKRPEFAVFTNLSQNMLDSNSKLSRKSKRSDSRNRKANIYQMIALARVELGAIKSAFWGDPNAFLNKSVTLLELPALSELLLDGAIMHRAALSNNPEFQAYMQDDNPSVSIKMIAYMRRLIMINQMVKAYREIQGRKLYLEQLAELRSWERESKSALDKLQKSIVSEKYSTSLVSGTLETNSSTCAAKLSMLRLFRGSPVQMPGSRKPQAKYQRRD